MSRQHINWAPQPPDDRWIPIVSVRRQQTLQVIAAGPCQGVKTHWLDGRSQPCCCPSPRLGVCAKQLARWKGYLPAYYHNGRPVIVEVTLGGVRNLPQLLRAEITGSWLRFKRPGEKSNAAVFVELLDQMPKALNVKPYDPKPSLFAMWELPTEEQQEPPDPEPGEGEVF